MDAVDLGLVGNDGAAADDILLLLLLSNACAVPAADDDSGPAPIPFVISLCIIYRYQVLLINTIQYTKLL